MLPRKNRISTKLFPKTLKGKTLQNEMVKIIIIQPPTPITTPKCAVIVPKKLTKTAVARNTLRRRVYSALGAIIYKLPNTYLFIFPKQTTSTLQELKTNLIKLLI